MKVRASYYQEFDADYSRDLPAEGYGGWQAAELELAPERTAVVCMHAWDVGDFGASPGHWRSVEYVPRSYRIAREIFPRLFDAVRASPLRLLHVVGGGVDYYSHHPGYQLAKRLTAPAAAPVERVESDPSLAALHRFKADRVWRGAHNQATVAAERQALTFLPQAVPVGDEGVAEDTPQLFALCRHFGLNHLIYCGFALDACLLTSPGGMHEISAHGVMCSTLREATLAVENKETARQEIAKQIALWRVALLYGFVFGVDDFISALGELTDAP